MSVWCAFNRNGIRDPTPKGLGHGRDQGWGFQVALAIHVSAPLPFSAHRCTAAVLSDIPRSRLVECQNPIHLKRVQLLELRELKCKPSFMFM